MPTSSPSPGLHASAAVDLDALAAAQAASTLEMQQYFAANSALSPVSCSLPSGASILCDSSQSADVPRPIVPASFVLPVLTAVHGLAHGGGNSTLRDVRRRFVWKNMSTDVKAYCRSCLPCQRAKVTRHSRAPVGSLEVPDQRFAALHLDLVGPLPASEGFTYLLTVVDRFTRWMDAIPLTTITAQACANALLRQWVSRFGVPSVIVTDQGRQFTSGLWSELAALLGVDRRRTTAYHPQCNGMVERLHRTLKDRLMSRACATGTNSWMDHLPFVLLGLRSSIREDSGVSPADLVYGCPLRLPGDMVSPDLAAVSPSPSDFSQHLQSVLSQAAPMPVVRHGVAPARVDPALQSVSHVLLRVDAVRRPLVPPYVGPFPVLQRGPKTFIILKNGRETTVTIDRLKPAFFLAPPLPVGVSGSVSSPDAALSAPVGVSAVPPSRPPSSDVSATFIDAPATIFTRSGRASRPVTRFVS